MRSRRAFRSAAVFGLGTLRGGVTACTGVTAAATSVSGMRETTKIAQQAGGLWRRAVFEEIAEAMTAAGMAKLAQGLGFDLADALARDGEVLPDLFEGVLAAVLQAEAHLDDLLFARAECFEYFGGLLAEIQIDDRLGGGHHAAVHEKIAQVRFFFFADWGLQ